jgi:hypothetical protein
MVIVNKVTIMDKSNFSFKIEVSRPTGNKDFYLPFSAHDIIWADALGRLVLATQPIPLSVTISLPEGPHNTDVQVPVNDTRTPYI